MNLEGVKISPLGGEEGAFVQVREKGVNSYQRRPKKKKEKTHTFIERIRNKRSAPKCCFVYILFSFQDSYANELLLVDQRGGRGGVLGSLC